MSEETGWLIEHPHDPRYGRESWYAGKDGFTIDSLQAVRFARQEDAEREIDRFQISLAKSLRATHHSWIGGPMDNKNYVRPIASELIRDERQKQRAKGYDSAHDDQHGDGALAQAAVVYAMDALGIASAEFSVAPGIAVAIDHYGMLWPFERKAWRPETPVRDLIKAAALLSAEIDRRLRAGDPWL